VSFLNVTFYNNTLQAWLIALGMTILILTFFIILRKILCHRFISFSEKTKSQVDDFAAELIKEVKLFFLFFSAIFVSSFFLTLTETINLLINRLFIISFLLQMAIWGNTVIVFWLDRLRSQRMETDAASVTTFSALGILFKIIIWAVVLLLILDNLGVNITTLVAGLGVGGIAIALAVQNILGDLFASLSIALDKPFVIGDFIIIDNFLGSVEHIGLKTTRIRSLSGEQLVFANSDLLKSRIKNYKRMYERRVVFTIGVLYQTPYEKVASIPKLIKKIIESKDLVRFDRTHFKEYGNFSLNFEIVYWVKNPDYNKYMDIQQAINLEIYQTFESEGIEFAYPTQTLYLNSVKEEINEFKK
jgi:small-conductance mechanosensitive channel